MSNPWVDLCSQAGGKMEADSGTALGSLGYEPSVTLVHLPASIFKTGGGLGSRTQCLQRMRLARKPFLSPAKQTLPHALDALVDLPESLWLGRPAVQDGLGTVIVDGPVVVRFDSVNQLQFVLLAGPGVDTERDLASCSQVSVKH